MINRSLSAEYSLVADTSVNNLVAGNAIADTRISEFFLVFSDVFIADTLSDKEFMVIDLNSCIAKLTRS